MWTPSEEAFLKGWEKSILNNSRLLDLAVKFLVLAENDLESYGHGGMYETLAKVAMETYLFIKDTNPSIELPYMPTLQNFISRRT